MAASPKGAGSWKAGLRSPGPCAPAPGVVSGTWEGLTSGCWMTSGPLLNVSARQDVWKLDFIGQSLEDPREASEFADTVANTGHNTRVC